MNCNDIHKIIERIASCCATAEEERTLATHIRDCRECQAIYEAAIVTARTLSMVSEIEPPASLSDEIMNAVSAESRTAAREPRKSIPANSKVIPFPGIFKYAAMAAAAAVVALLLLPFLRGGNDSTPVTASNDSAMTPAVSIPAKGPSTDTVEMTTPEINWECSADDITGSPMIAVTGKGYKRIVPGDRLIVGSNIRTDSTSSVKLRYRDNTQVNVKPGSEVVVKVNALMLRQGATWLQVTKKGSRFEVTTPTAIAGVLGTRFGVFHSPDGKACISVFEGKVSVTGTRDMLGQAIPASRGQRVLLEAGRKVIFTPSTGMSDIFNTSDSEESIWKSGSRALPSALVEVPAVESDAMDTIPAVNSNAPAVSVDTGSTSSTLPEDLEGEVHYNSMQGLDNNVE